MNRRNVLAGMGTVGTVAIAGCANQGEASTEQEESDTDQEEPESKAPRIQRVELLSDYEEFEDVADNAIESTTVGSNPSIGAIYEYWFGDGTFNATAQTEIFDETGSRFSFSQDTTEQLTDREGWGEVSYYDEFDTDDASPGEYEARVLVRDNDAEETSEPMSTTFTIEE